MDSNISTPSDTAPSPRQGNAGSPLPSDLTREQQEKKSWECVNHSTLHLVVNLFPAPTLGQVFIARFVERAATEQSIIPDLKTGEVMICAKSIATLAEELNIAYDTAQKYVALFKALGMLQKRKFMGQLAFILSLGIYLPPPNLEADLDYLLQRSKAKKSRTKFHDLVASVKERCLVYGLISQEWTSALRQLHTLLQPPEGITRSKLVQRLAQAQYLVGTMMARAMTEPLPRGEALLAQNLPRSPGMTDSDACQRASESTQQGTTTRRKSEELPPNRVSAKVQKPGLESTRQGSPGEFAESSATPNLSGQGVRVDSRSPGQSPESTQIGISGRFEGSSVVQNLSKLSTQVDSSPPDQSSKSIQSTYLARFAAPSDAKNLPTRPAPVDSQGLANVNVGNLITSNLNVNVEIVAAFLCRIFEEPVSKRGIYSKLLREGCNQAEAVHAAAIFTLVHFHREQTIENPAAVFIARCKAYHRTGIPDEAAELLVEFGALTYQQLLDALRKPSPSLASSRPGSPSPASAAHPATPASLPPLPQWGTIPRLVPVESTRAGMSRQEALQVVARARGDLRTKMCCVDLERLADGTYAVLLDNTITAIPRQTYVYSLQEWEARTATIKDCFELFGVTTARRRCLADSS
jgi:hypothetical protein